MCRALTSPTGVTTLGVTGEVLRGSTQPGCWPKDSERTASSFAQRLREDMITLAAGAGLREYFNPRTGAGHGTSNFSWSAALLLHVLPTTTPT